MSQIGPLNRNKITQFILASNSPRRKELVAMLNLSLPVSIFSADIEEIIEPGWSSAEAVERLSLDKARAVQHAFNQGKNQDERNSKPVLILGADTVVTVDKKILGKPKSEEEAFLMLSMLQGRTHEVHTGLALIRSDSHQSLMSDVINFGAVGQYRTSAESAVGHTVSKVTFRPMTEKEILSYVKTGIPMDKAGAYGIQGLGSIFIEKIEGDFYSIMGLPINMLYAMLQSFDINVM